MKHTRALPLLETPWPQPDRRSAALQRADLLAAMLRIARVLVLRERRVDLAGLEDEVGRLCAATLDLPLDEGRGLLIALHTLASELDTLLGLLRVQEA